jgi:hypothetical protein
MVDLSTAYSESTLDWKARKLHWDRDRFWRDSVFFGGKRIQNLEGYDIGYALAANSCEGVSSVDACTVAAL